MREIVATGTDVAAVAMGDPTLLDGLREHAGRGYEVERTRAEAAGAMWRKELDADGGYLFHVFVDEEPPDHLKGFLQDPIPMDTLHVPSGRLLIGGEECFIGGETLAKYPHMGREIRIEAGDYGFTAYRVEAPDDYLDVRFAERASESQQRAWAVGNRLGCLCVLLTLAALVAAYFLYLRTLSVGLALAPIAGVVAAWWLQARYHRGPAFRSAEKLFREIEIELPSIAVVMRRHGAEAGPPSTARPGPAGTEGESSASGGPYGYIFDPRSGIGDKILVGVLGAVILLCVVATVLAFLRVI